MGVSIIRQRRKNRITYRLKIRENGEVIDRALFTASRNDKEAREKAERIRANTEANYRNGVLTMESHAAQSENFMEYFRLLSESKRTPKPYVNTLKHLQKYTRGQAVPFEKVTKAFCYGFRDYLAKLVDTGDLKGASAATYFNKFKAAITEARNRDLLYHNPLLGLPGIEKEDTEKEFLELDELQRLAGTPMPDGKGADVIRALFLFICYCGLRPSDALKLTWEDIRGDKLNGFYLEYVPAKVRRKGVRRQHLPLHHEAVRMMWELRAKAVASQPDDKIFLGLPSTNIILRTLKRWAKAAGIKKNVSLYTGRHSFASNLVLNGADLYAVSKLLAHTSMKPTQSYAHLTERAKRSTVELLPEITLTKRNELQTYEIADSHNS